jgi:long-subunit fatty acid transport protein
MNVQQIQGGFTAGGDALSQQSATLGATATLMDNKEVDTQQTGAGITPILGVNLSPAEGLNIGIKYEFKTFMTLTNETTKDDTGLFPDKAKSGSDIPAILAIGADYKFSDKLNVQLSYNTYFDKNVDWGNNVYQQKRTIDNNYWEIALGAQYAISDNFAISAGVMHSNTGVSEDYQSDFSYSNDSYSGGLGFEWKLSKKLTFDAGAMMTKYIDYEKSFDGYKETYGKSNVLFALGLSYSIF